jgi:hypothetical protein
MKGVATAVSSLQKSRNKKNPGRFLDIVLKCYHHSISSKLTYEPCDFYETVHFTVPYGYVKPQAARIIDNSNPVT